MIWSQLIQKAQASRRRFQEIMWQSTENVARKNAHPTLHASSMPVGLQRCWKRPCKVTEQVRFRFDGCVETWLLVFLRTKKLWILKIESMRCRTSRGFHSKWHLCKMWRPHSDLLMMWTSSSYGAQTMKRRRIEVESNDMNEPENVPGTVRHDPLGKNTNDGWKLTTTKNVVFIRQPCTEQVVLR